MFHVSVWKSTLPTGFYLPKISINSKGIISLNLLSIKTDTPLMTDALSAPYIKGDTPHWKTYPVGLRGCTCNHQQRSLNPKIIKPIIMLTLKIYFFSHTEIIVQTHKHTYITPGLTNSSSCCWGPSSAHYPVWETSACFTRLTQTLLIADGNSHRSDKHTTTLPTYSALLVFSTSKGEDKVWEK